MLANAFQIRHLSLLFVAIVLIVSMIGCFNNNDTEKEEDQDENETETETAYLDKDFDPMIVSGYEEIISFFSNGVFDLSINGDQMAMLSQNEHKGTVELSVGSLTDEMQPVVLDEFADLEESAFDITWVPNSQQILLSFKEESTWSITTYDIDTGEKEFVHSFKESISNIAFSNEEQHLFFAQPLPSDSSKFTVRMNNWSMNAPLDIFQVEGNSNNQSIREIAISPDRNNIAYTLYDEESGAFQLWLYDSTVNRKTHISTQGSEARQPTWSKDGNVLAYTESIPNEGQAIFAYHLPNDTQWMVTKTNGNSSNPAWTDDGELIFVSKTKDQDQLYKVDFKEAYQSEMTSVEDSSHKEDHPTYDVAILNGIVVDPETETFKFGYNVGVTDGEIASITKDDITGEEIIDADGNIVSPGFIDILSFNPNGGGEYFKVMDGVTTHLGMHGSGIEFETMLNHYDNAGMINHFGGAIQHSHMRTRLNIGPYDAPNEAQIEEMREMTERQAKDGAIGISFSPEYYPGMTSEEILAVMEVGKKYDLVNFFHVRYSTMFAEKTNLDALEEVIEYARILDVPVQVQHINSTGGTFSMEESLAMIDEARAEGLDITIDMYPYNYWATRANTARFDKGFLERFQIDYSDLQVANTTERLTEETFAGYRMQRILLIAFGIPEEDVRLAIQPEYGMIGSDTIMVPPDYNNHPRGSGTFSRVYKKYVRETETIPFMQALRMMTINSANRLDNVALDLQTKARLQEGMDADIAIFDYEKIEDTASPENVASFSKGINYVLVEGEIVKDLSGIRKNVLPGRVIRSYFE